jgi:uncharacterized membrane protein HdeD (DUF308 family)
MASPGPADPDAGGPASAARSAAPRIAAGVVSVLVGVLVLVWPDVSIVVLAWLFGIQLVIAGILQLVAACWRDAGVAARVLLGLSGTFSILVGLLCLRGPLQTAVLLGLLVGATWVVTGIIGVVHAIGLPRDRSRGWGIVSGVLTAIGGGIVLLYPGATVVVLVWLLGLVLLVTGLAVLIEGMAAGRTGRRAAASSDARPEPAAPSRSR